MSSDTSPLTTTAPFAPAEIAGISPPLIGRDEELQQLLHQLYGVIEGGAARLITIVGPAGIGKSRLAHEFRQVVGRLPEPVPLFTLQADRQSTAQPYSLIRMLVATLFRIREGDTAATARARIEQGVATLLGSDSEEKAHFIGQLAGYDFADSPHLRGALAEPRQLRDRALHYAAQSLGALTAQMPLVLLIDDFHYADDSSIDAVAQVVREGRELGMLVVCLAQQRLYERRPDWGADIDSLRIGLGPLDERASRRLVAEILRKAGKLPVDLRNLLVSKAEGNPFYVEELIKMLISDGVIVPGDTAWTVRQGRLARLRIPATLGEVLRARVQALTAAEREFVMRAAVVGRFFWAEAALQLDGATRAPSTLAAEPQGASLLASLEQQELIVPRAESRFVGQREYAFRHELLHEIAYEQVPPVQRARYHQRVAEWLHAHSGERAGAFAALIAEHYERAEQPQQAAEWYLRAGNHARETYAVEPALQEYRTALELLPAEAAAERIACYEGIGEMQLWAARLSDAAASYTRMAELAAAAGDPVAAARGWNGLAFVQDHNLEYPSSKQSALRSIALAESVGATRELALGLFHLAWAELRLNNLQAAHAIGERAIALLAQADEPATAARWTGLLGVIYDMLGDTERASYYQHEALRYNQDAGNLVEVITQLNNLGSTANLRGDFAAGLGYLQEAQLVSRKIGSRVMDIFILSNLGITYNGLGEHQAAEETVRRGIELSELSRMPVFSEYYYALSEASLRQGRVTEAVEAAQQALELARSHEGPREVAAAWRALGAAISEMSAPLGAAPCFEESARLFEQSGADGERARTLRAWAAHEQRHGNRARGHELLRQARTIFEQAGLTLELARTPTS